MPICIVIFDRISIGISSHNTYNVEFSFCSCKQCKRDWAPLMIKHFKYVILLFLLVIYLSMPMYLQLNLIFGVFPIVSSFGGKAWTPFD